MGTFHHDKHELHGITVVVETPEKVFVGRCDDMDAAEVILLDADEHAEGQGGRSKEEYLKRAAKFGVWKKHARVSVPREEVAWVRRLSEFTQGIPADLKGGMATATAVAEPPVQVAAAPAPKPAAPGAQDVVLLTEAAKEEVRRLIRDDKKVGLGLRLAVSGGGCSGLVYKLDFDKKKDGDVAIVCEGFEVYLDKKSTIYLRGVTLDHQKGLSGKGFIFKNPNATNTCGCGESFSV